MQSDDYPLSYGHTLYTTHPYPVLQPDLPASLSDPSTMATTINPKMSTEQLTQPLHRAAEQAPQVLKNPAKRNLVLNIGSLLLLGMSASV